MRTLTALGLRQSWRIRREGHSDQRSLAGSGWIIRMRLAIKPAMATPACLHIRPPHPPRERQGSREISSSRLIERESELFLISSEALEESRQEDPAGPA